MSDVLAIVPAKTRSTGIPGKNFRPLAGLPPWQRARRCAIDAGCQLVAVSCEDDALVLADWCVYDTAPTVPLHTIRRPPELALDTTPMLDVIRHVLDQVPGPEDQIICLLQPTQPLRQPKHIIKAINLLEASMADSVVSVVELPLAHSPEMVCYVGADYLMPWLWEYGLTHCDQVFGWADMPTRRQDVKPAFIRDGTVYAFRRSTVSRYGNIYGPHVVPLIIDPAETCPLDTMADWHEAERRLRGQ